MTMHEHRKKRQRVGSTSAQSASILSQSDKPYQALPQHHIRVLCLELGLWDSPLRASFDVISLDPTLAAKSGHQENKGYEAISYVWGEPVFPHEICIGGSDVTLRLTTSLYNALRHFRRTDSTRRLWADALCINQADDLEKGVQVAMMAQIYQQAIRTLIWLGLACEADALTFAAGNIYSNNPRFKTLDTTSPEGLDTALRLLDDKHRESTCCSCCSTYLTCEHGSIAIQALLSAAEITTRSWFTRLWVLQEVQLVVDVEGRSERTILCCGLHRMYFQDFSWLTEVFRAVARSAEKRPLLGISATRAQELYACALRLSQHSYESFVLQTFWLAYCTFTDRNCSDSRDRVFALRSCMQIDHPSLEPDYTLASAEVFRRLVCVFMDIEYVVARTRRLRSAVGKGDNFEDYEHDILDWEFMPWAPLAFVGTERRNGNLRHRPSWVPNLHHLTEQTTSKALLYTRDARKHLTQFRAAYEKFEWRLGDRDGKILKVRGRICGRVGRILPESSWPSTSDIEQSDFRSDAIAMIESWYSRCLAFARQEASLRALDEVHDFHDLLFCRLYDRKIDLTDSAAKKALSNRDCVSLQQTLAQLWPDIKNANEMEILSRDLLFPILYIESRQLDPNMRPLQELDRHRLLCRFTSDDGDVDVGWVPQGTDPGDDICLISGAPYPFVVRAAAEGKYTLIGDAYTHNHTLKTMLGGDCHESRGPTNDSANVRWSARGPESPGMTVLDLWNSDERNREIGDIDGEPDFDNEPSEQDSENENCRNDDESASSTSIDHEMQRLIDDLGWITFI